MNNSQKICSEIFQKRETLLPLTLTMTTFSSSLLALRSSENTRKCTYLRGKYRFLVDKCKKRNKIKSSAAAQQLFRDLAVVTTPAFSSIIYIVIYSSTNKNNNNKHQHLQRYKLTAAMLKNFRSITSSILPKEGQSTVVFFKI